MFPERVRHGGWALAACLRPSPPLRRSKFLLAVGCHSIRGRTGTAGHDLRQLRANVVQGDAVVGSDPLYQSAVDQLTVPRPTALFTVVMRAGASGQEPEAV